MWQSSLPKEEQGLDKQRKVTHSFDGRETTNCDKSKTQNFKEETFMKKARKVTAFLLSMAMVMSMAFSAFATLPSDAVDSPNGEAIETLGALDIMVGDKESGNFRPEDTIRRSEFAKIAVEAMGLGNVAETSNQATKYPDVVADHWANGYINVATNQGIVIGDDEGNFRPDDTISYAEVMTVMVRAIGHDPVAETKGGFPTGYLVVGSQEGISKNAIAGADDAVTREMAAQLVFNSLTINLMEQVGFGSDVRYEVVDKTLLSDKLDVTKGYGQITATASTALNGNSSLREDEIKISVDGEEEIFTLAETSHAEGAKNLLGFNVVYYVREETNGDNTLLLATAEAGKNNALEVIAENIEEISEQDSGSLLKYWKDKENDKQTEEADISADAKFIYNGKAESIDDVTTIKPEAGFIRLLDVDRDDVYDIVFVTSYENYVVEEVVPNSNRVTDKYGKPSLVLDPKDKNVSFSIYRGGQKIAITDLNEWDVLSVAKSKDSKLYTIEAVNHPVTGTVTEISGDKYFIDGEEYKIAANYTDGIKLNDEGTFYLDIEGKIAAVDNTSTRSSNYAYLVNAALGTGFEDSLEIKLFDKDGTTKTLKSGEKIKFNGTNNQTPEDVLAALKTAAKEDAAGKVQAQLVTYEVNSKDELIQLNTATDLEGDIDKDVFGMNMSGTYKYKEASKKLGTVNVNEDTIVFDIPAGKTDTADYSIQDISIFEDETDYDVSIFDMGEDMTAKVVIVTNSKGIANADAPIAIVDQVTSTNNADDVTVDKLYAYQNGEKVSFLASEEGVLVKDVTGRTSKKVVRGDVLQLKLNAKGEIDSIRVLFDSEEMETEFVSNPAEDLQVVYGKVDKKFPTSINVTVDAEDEESNPIPMYNYNISGVRVYQYDSAKSSNAISVVEPGDIAKYDELDPSRVLIRLYKDVVQEIVIVK